MVRGRGDVGASLVTSQLPGIGNVGLGGGLTVLTGGSSQFSIASTSKAKYTPQLKLRNSLNGLIYIPGFRASSTNASPNTFFSLRLDISLCLSNSVGSELKADNAAKNITPS